MSSMQPIKSAPRDGTVILTDGTAKFLDKKNWCSRGCNGWYLCDASGNVPSCADDGMSVSNIAPTKWKSLEEAME